MSPNMMLAVPPPPIQQAFFPFHISPQQCYTFRHPPGHVAYVPGDLLRAAALLQLELFLEKRRYTCICPATITVYAQSAPRAAGG